MRYPNQYLGQAMTKERCQPTDQFHKPHSAPVPHPTVHLSHIPQCTCPISHNTPVPYPTMHHFGTKMYTFLFQWGALWYGTGALWYLWDYSNNGGHVSNPTNSPTATRRGLCDSLSVVMTTTSNGDIFCVTGHLCGELTGYRWIPVTKASDVELWWFLWSAPKQTVELTIEMLVIWDTVAFIMMSL